TTSWRRWKPTPRAAPSSALPRARGSGGATSGSTRRGSRASWTSSPCGSRRARKRRRPRRVSRASLQVRTERALSVRLLLFLLVLLLVVLLFFLLLLFGLGLGRIDAEHLAEGRERLVLG